MSSESLTPTRELLGVSNATILRRGITMRCAVCGSRGTHHNWLRIKQRCDTCSFRFERIAGQSIGYIGLNTIVTFSSTFVVLLVGAILMIPKINVAVLLGMALVPSLLLPIAFLPISRTLWTSIDVMMRPLRPGEIDPRFEDSASCDK